MADELDQLKQALRAERVQPRPEAKQAALAAALGAFDAKKAPARQGSRLAARLRIAAEAASETLTGKRPMRTTHALAGGVSLAVLTLAVVTAANLHSIDAFSRRDAAPIAGDTPDLLTRPASPALVEAEQPQVDRAPSKAVPSQPEPAAEPESIPRQRLRSEADSMPLPDSTPIAATEGLAASADMAASAPAGPAEPGRATAVAPSMPAPAMSAPAMSAPSFADEALPPPAYLEQGRDHFEAIATNPLKITAEEPVSTFSLDVDTASYSFTRAAINNGVLPQEDAVRVEELVNYFPYDYPAPESRDAPFRPTVTVLPTPWNAATKLVHIGIKGFDIAAAERPRANLVFLIDTSGSMNEPNRLPLLANSLKLLLDTLSPDDTVSIVAYAGSAGTVLEPTGAAEKGKITAALGNLRAGGSTAGGEGIRQAYQLAKASFVEGGINRVILATDGDFNVGITDTEELKSFVEREREAGVFLSVLGFGRGNTNDELMQALAQNGNGAAAYIDTLNEARKVLVEEATSTLFPIAKDVKIQVEFNPATVSEYRLIGFETRLLAREDFNNDRVDAGEIGSGRTVTALYEITPAGSSAELVDGLHYGSASDTAQAGAAQLQQAPSVQAAPVGVQEGSQGELGFLKIRYKLPNSDTSRLIETPIPPANNGAVGAAASSEAQFAAAVAAFAQILRGGRYTRDFDHDDVIALAQASKGPDEFGYRAEFINLARLAKSAASLESQGP